MFQLLHILCVLLLNLNLASGFFSKIASKFSSTTLHARMGKHGQNFKYLSVLKGRSSEHYPRTVPIAGIFPEITPEDVLGPAQIPLGMPGKFLFDFTDPSGPQLGTIAVPGSDVLTFADDPVAIVTHNSHLGIKVPNEDGAEVVAIVDRMETKFNPDMFYVWSTPENQVDIGSMDSMQPGYTILGRIILTMVPYTPGGKPKVTGWAEEEEEDDDE